MHSTTMAATVVPSAAVQQGPDGNFVYVAQPDATVRLLPVKVIRAAGEQTAIDATLAPGTQVVTDGIDRLKDGAKIRAGDAAEPAAEAPLNKANAKARPRGTAKQ